MAPGVPIVLQKLNTRSANGLPEPNNDVHSTTVP